MSNLAVNTITDASGGNTAQINGATPTAYNTMGRNRIINGDMRIDQRNAGAAVTINALANIYTVDRWVATGQATDGVFTVDQVTDAPAGFSNSIKITVTTADASIGSTQYYLLTQQIEGNNVADLGFGTANAKTVTLSFWVRSSLTGTFGGVLQNSAQNRNYPYTYTISAADTWEYKTVTIAGDTTGTWLTDNGIGISLRFQIGMGSTYVGTAGSWSGTTYYGATGATNLISTNGATFYITGVQLEVGSVATEFERRPYGTELALCQRYYYVHADGSIAGTCQIGVGGYQTASHVETIVAFPVTMRTSPSLVQNTGTNYYWAERADTMDYLNSFTSYASRPTNVLLYNLTEASGTQGNYARISCSSSGKIAFNSEL